MLGGPPELRAALGALGQILTARGLRYELVVVGGAGLALLGFIDRPTRDVDVVAAREGGRFVPVAALPPPLAEAVRDVARISGLSERWLNVGPASLMDFGLPAGYQARLSEVAFGGLVVHVLSRIDQIALKLYAAVDQGPRSKHVNDLEALSPSASELVAAARWAQTHDPSPGFERDLRAALRALGATDVDL